MTVVDGTSGLSMTNAAAFVNDRPSAEPVTVPDAGWVFAAASESRLAGEGAALGVSLLLHASNTARA